MRFLDLAQSKISITFLCCSGLCFIVEEYAKKNSSNVLNFLAIFFKGANFPLTFNQAGYFSNNSEPNSPELLIQDFKKFLLNSISLGSYSVGL